MTDSERVSPQLSAVARPRYLGEINSQEPGENHGWHNHDFGQLISASYGSMYVGTPNRVLLLSPAMAIWIPPDAEHWIRYVSANEMLYVDVNRQEASKLGAQSRIVKMTPLLNALMLATMPELVPSRTECHTEALHDLLRHEILAASDLPLSIIMPLDKRIRGIAQEALNNPGLASSVETWLANAAASRKTAERLFIAETGMPPARWLRHARLLHAISQIAAGAKISSVALDLGYESSSAFTYMFRRTLGMSPSSLLGNTRKHRALTS
ncbi:AraC-like DNA-binding protein/quercetin dioxygenase-like cupin family protein [Sinorhizobium kostiense]|uniref:AraC-like DNA-binding protein/quercetin dioxygenase-like cupin family protein n=1 Tax=Sinorhizobium kostiense TaxID=76747 RepID=A0ABS4QV04_9HYPH|nr:AraC family transcriptional regulator [Sinorhizobium kostiense]MBP2234477.1 AraC-like DNA-binding protein/quercetin dioxygenase-like cupin family protein [Sinorhizobium kostiense]